MKRILAFLAIAVVAAVMAGAASADYGRGAVYQVELSMNIPGKQGGGIWIWFALNQDGTGDYTGSDCGHGGQGAASDKGDVTWHREGDRIVIEGVTYNGIPTDPQAGDFSPFSPTITVPASYGHYTGVDDSYTTLPAWIPSGIGFTQLQVAP